MYIVLKILFYLTVVGTNLLIYLFVSKRRYKWSQIILFIIPTMIASYIFDHYGILLDPFYLLLFSYLTDKYLPLSYHVFYSFYTTTVVEISTRVIAYVILPTLLNVSIDQINQSQWLVYTCYALVLPYYFFCHFLFHIDYRAIRQVTTKSLSNHLVHINISMILFFIFVQGSVVLEYYIPNLPYSIAHLRYLIVSVYVLLFLWNLYHLNSSSVKMVEDEEALDRKNHYQNLISFNSYILTLYDEITAFKNQTKDSVERFGQILNNGNMEQLDKDFDTIFKRNENPFKNAKYDLDRLINIKIPTLKSFLASKLFEAYDQGIDLTVEIPDTISDISMDLLDMMIVFSVFCDNAREAAKESEAKKMDFALFQLDDRLILIINNSILVEKVDINAIFNKGFSTKGDQRGLGLANVMTILEEYPYCILSTKSDNYTLTQKLEIPINTKVF